MIFKLVLGRFFEFVGEEIVKMGVWSCYVVKRIVVGWVGRNSIGFLGDEIMVYLK